jgi:ubiquinone/menaquinone biosynthesis C-methylase UbiE
LEIGCGRGGGASYIARYLKPRSMVGIDIAEKAIAFCNQRHVVEGLRFLQGDAESLPFADQSIDRVLNVESSHCYGNIQRFFSEVRRVLRPGGYFLFTDYRDTQTKMERLRQQLLHVAGLEVVREEKINLYVLQALELDNTRKQAIIKQKVPWILRQPFHVFAGMQGTEAYNSLMTGVFDYRSFILQKSTN